MAMRVHTLQRGTVRSVGGGGGSTTARGISGGLSVRRSAGQPTRAHAVEWSHKGRANNHTWAGMQMVSRETNIVPRPLAHTTTNGNVVTRGVLRRTMTSSSRNTSKEDNQVAEKLSGVAEAATETSAAMAKRSLSRLDSVGGLKRLWLVARGEWKTLTVAVAAMAVGSAAYLVLPMAMGTIVDSVTGANDAYTIEEVAAGLFGIFVVSGMATYIRWTSIIKASERITAIIRKDLFRAIVRKDAPFFDHNRSGELLNRLSSDATVISTSLTSNVSASLRSAVEAVGSAAFLFSISPKLALVSLSVLPPLAVGAVTMYGRLLKKLSRELQDSLGHASEFAEERISNISTVKLFSTEERETDRYGHLVEDAYDLGLSVGKKRAQFFTATMFAGNLSMLAVLGYGSHLIQMGEMTIGDLSSFLMYSIYMGIAFSGLSSLYADFMKAIGSSERVFQLIDGPTEQVLRAGRTQGVDVSHMRGEIEFRDVHFRYPSRPDLPVLQGFNLTIKAGSVVAVVGQSGSGKSTIANLIAKLYDVERGQVLIDGVDVQDIDSRQLRRQLGVVAQEPVMFTGTIRENLEYGLERSASVEEMDRVCNLANASEFVDRLPKRYEEPVVEHGNNLSGGQKQRLSIARALMPNPSVLLLDEFTSSLDNRSERLVQEALEKLVNASSGSRHTVLMIAHRLSTIRYADEIVVLDQGQVVERGTHDELMALGGQYARLVSSQV